MLTGRTPTKAEKAHMAAVAALGCVVCWREMGVYSPAGIHHTAGKTRRGAHMQVLPLCSVHHQTGGWGTAFHAGKAEWEQRHGSQMALLEFTNNLLGGAHG